MNHIRKINLLPQEEQRYLYGECDRWCLENFEYGLEIVAIMERDNHENGITDSYLRDSITGYCYDVRGESDNDEEIQLYSTHDAGSGRHLHDLQRRRPDGTGCRTA